MSTPGETPISSETRQRIEEGLRNWTQADSEARKRFEAAQQKLDQVFQPLEDAISASERLTEQDFAIRINTRD